MTKLLILTILTCFVVSCTMAYERNFLSRIENTEIGSVVTVKAFVSNKSENRALYPSIFLEDDDNFNNEQCIHLVNLNDFDSEHGMHRQKVEAVVKFIENPFQGKITLYTCSKKVAELISIRRI